MLLKFCFLRYLHCCHCQVACGSLIHCYSTLQNGCRRQGGDVIFSGIFLCPDQVELRRAVEEAVKETPEYRCMQSQFSVLYNESLQLKAHLDEARTLLHGTRTTHQRQVELIEVTPVLCQTGEHYEPISYHCWFWWLWRCLGNFLLVMIYQFLYLLLMSWEILQGHCTKFCPFLIPQRDEVSLHKKLRTEVIQLEDTLAQVRKEYEMLRIEFEQTLAANEQAGMELFCYLKKKKIRRLRCSTTLQCHSFSTIKYLFCQVSKTNLFSCFRAGHFLGGVAKYCILLIIQVMTEHFALLKNYFGED